MRTLRILISIIQVCQIVYDIVKLEVSFLSQQLGTVGINFPENVANYNTISFRDVFAPE